MWNLGGGAALAAVGVKRTERFGVPRPGTPEPPWQGELDLTGISNVMD